MCGLAKRWRAEPEALGKRRRYKLTPKSYPARTGGLKAPTSRATSLHPTPSRCPLTAPQLMRPAAAGVRIALKVLGGGVCRPRADLTILSHAQGCARRFVQMQAPARRCCQLRACMATGTAAIFGTTSMPWLRAPIMLVIGGWGPDFAPSGTAILSPVHLMIVPGARLRLISRPETVHRHRPAAPRR